MIHGGDIYEKKIEYDFSVNLNPLGCPEKVINAIKEGISNISLYPDYSERKLRQSIAEALSLSGSDKVVCGSGASSIFMGICMLERPKRALIITPSFYGYEYALRAVKCEYIDYYKLTDTNDYRVCEEIVDMISPETDIVFLGHPNNPTGKLIDSEIIEKILCKSEKCNCTVVADECFYEMSLNEKTVSFLNYIDTFENLFVVRAYTKLFSIPGVRLGYAVSNVRRAGELMKCMPEWAVSVLAENAGVCCADIVKNSDFIEKTKAYIDKEKTYMSIEFEKMGVKVIPTDTSFILLYDKRISVSEMAEKGILLRDCQNFTGLLPGHVRVAVKNHQDNAYLIRELSACLNYKE